MHLDTCIDPPPPLPPNVLPQRRVFPIPGVPAGNYALEFSISNLCNGSIMAERPLTVYQIDEEPLRAGHETPARGQTVSGVGLIRGWACYDKTLMPSPGVLYSPGTTGSVIGNVSYSINGGKRVTIPHGTPRGDTASVCGEGNILNGYGAVINWGRFGQGEHEFAIYIDGNLERSLTFNVAATDDPFLTGLDAEYELEGFPDPESTVTVRWPQADQNFIIVNYN